MKDDPDIDRLFRVEFRPKRGLSIPSMERFGHLLKVALRTYGFEAVRMKVVAADVTDPPPKPTGPS